MEAERSTPALLLHLLTTARRVLSDTAEPYDHSRLDRRDPEAIRLVLPLLERFNGGYLKLRVEGAEHLTGEPSLFVGNHSGGIMGPDLSCTIATLWRRYGVDAPIYAMAHDLAMRHLRPLAKLMQRIGCIRADPENAHRVLSTGGHVLVYPGGELDAFRHFRDRNKIIFGRRAGFVRVARRARVPIVPIVAHGAHSSCIVVDEGEWLARVLGLHAHRVERMPIALAFPWGLAAGPLPYFPMPFPITLRILPPIHVGPEDEPSLVKDVVVGRMQTAMDQMAARPT